ncbi:protein kinase domain-containing protein [Arthrobacter sp. SA17]
MDKFQRGGPEISMESGGEAFVTGPVLVAADAATKPVVSGYDVGRQLGKGGSAAVWLVSEKSTGRSFALKCLEDAPDDFSTEESIRREIRILSALDHPHLVRAHGVVRLGGVGDGSVGLVMDFAAGGSLAELVGIRGKLSVGETVTVLTPMAQALAYLHSQGFTHSDVSPGNVLFSAQGKPLLADLGVSKMVGDAVPVSGQGTLGFKDPAPDEPLRAGLQPERDVYSLAAVGWYCLTGNPPPKTAHRPPLTLLLQDAPPELAAALEAALHDERRLRPTAREFATAVYRSAEAAPVDLAASVHPTVIPELLTRRSLPPQDHPLVRFVGYRECRRRYREWRRRFAKYPARQGPHTGMENHLRPVPSATAIASHGTRRGLRTARRRRSSRLLPVAGFAVVLLSIGVGITWWVPEGFGAALASRPEAGIVSPRAGGAGDEASPAAESSAGVPKDRPEEIPQEVHEQIDSGMPEQAVRGLAWLRSTAFSSGRHELLNQVNVQGSDAAAADARTVAVLAQSGHRLAGFTTTLSKVGTERESTADRAVLSITASTSAYQELDASGALVANLAAGGEEQLRLVLLLVDGRWRIQEILPPM